MFAMQPIHHHLSSVVNGLNVMIRRTLSHKIAPMYTVPSIVSNTLADSKVKLAIKCLGIRECEIKKKKNNPMN